MSNELPEIRVIGVDREAIKISSETKDSWAIPFKLSQKPDQSWERKFYEVQHKDPNAMKRKIQIVEDFIKVEVSDLDDLQKVLDVVKVEVTQTNALCEADYQKKVKIRQELEALRQREINVTQKLKDNSDRLEFQ